MPRRWISRLRPRVVIAAAALALAGSLTAAAPASAAATSAAAATPCGTGYSYYTARYMYRGATMVGHISLYTASAGRLCAVAWTAGPERGVSRYRSISMWDGNEADLDDGVFATYAGPVYTTVDGSCTSIYAQFGQPSVYSSLHLPNFVCWAST